MALQAVFVAALLSLSVADQVEKVKVGFYGEALCPGCDQLAETTMSQAVKEVGEIFDLEYVPWGNARLTPSGSFQCQHGPTECVMNTLEACLMHFNPSRSAWWPYVRCTEAHGYKQTAATGKKCAEGLGINWEQVVECQTGSLGRKLELVAYNMTMSLNPPHTYTPWVTVNGQHLVNTDNLISTVCNEYQGSQKPSACTAKHTPVNDRPLELCKREH